MTWRAAQKDSMMTSSIGLLISCSASSLGHCRAVVIGHLSLWNREIFSVSMVCGLCLLNNAGDEVLCSK